MEPGIVQIIDAQLVDVVREGMRLVGDTLTTSDGWQVLAQAGGDSTGDAATGGVTTGGETTGGAATGGEPGGDSATGPGASDAANSASSAVQSIAGGQPSHDFSIWAIILRADIIVQAVIVLLVFASIWSWAIIFDKILLMRRLNRRITRFEEAFWSGGSVDDLYDKLSDSSRDPMSAMFVAAMREWHRSSAGRAVGTVRSAVADRIDRVMHVVLGREMQRVERFSGFLATVGNTAPFVGLFGTVWGIMNSFQDIAIQRNTNLATVAPGISEALFATALGLVAAIPAVVAYNKFVADFDRIGHRLEVFQSEFSAIISRQLDQEDN